MRPSTNGGKGKASLGADGPLSRSAAIDRLRQACLSITDDEHSLCQVATQLRILCHGFSQWKTWELKKRFDWIAAHRPHITRAELEDLANRWQLARQLVRDTPVSCDTQQAGEPHQVCEGWDSHDNRELARWILELSGERVLVVDDEPE